MLRNGSTGENIGKHRAQTQRYDAHPDTPLSCQSQSLDMEVCAWYGCRLFSSSMVVAQSARQGECSCAGLVATLVSWAVPDVIYYFRGAYQTLRARTTRGSGMATWRSPRRNLRWCDNTFSFVEVQLQAPVTDQCKVLCRFWLSIKSLACGLAKLVGIPDSSA